MIQHNTRRNMHSAALLTALLATGFAAQAQDTVRRGDVHQHSVATARLAIEDGRLDLSLQFPGANLVGFEHPPRDDEQAAALDAATARLATGDWLVLPADADCTTSVIVERPGFGVDSSASEPGEAGSAFDGSTGSQGHAHGAGHEHGDGHEHDQRHDRSHDHGHEHGAEQEHGHDHGHGHDHDHEHEHDDDRHHDHDGEADHGHAHDEHPDHAEFHVDAVALCERPGALATIELDLFTDWPDNRSIRVDAISPSRQWRKELSPDDRSIDLE